MGRRFNKEKVSKKVGLTIRKIREDRNWTLEGCEEHGWKSWSFLQEIESGNHNITIQTIVNLANLFGVHPSVFFENV